MKTTSALLAASVILTLSACGGGSDGAKGSDGGSATSGGSSDVSDGSFVLKTAADQVASSLGRGATYKVDGTSVTYTFTEGSSDENGTAACQIAMTVFDSVAPGEVETLVMDYPGGRLDCKEIL